LLHPAGLHAFHAGSLQICLTKYGSVDETLKSAVASDGYI